MKRIAILAIVLAMVVLVGFRLRNNRIRNTSQTEDISLGTVTVSVADVVRKPSSFTLDFTGTLYPFKQLEIAAEAQGKVTSLNCELGQSVPKGSSIATIDDKIKQLNFESAKIDAERLEKDFERITNLYKGGTASEQEFDNARTSYGTAKIKSDEAEKQLSYTKVTAPIAGTITAKNVEEGTYVNPGSIIASILDISRLKVKLNASEASVYYLKVGDTARISTDVYPGVVFDGKISFVSPSGDGAHNYPVEIEMENTATTPLKAGTFVNVSIEINSNRDGLYIPREALQGSIKEAKVYVAENGKAKLKDIIVRGENKEYLEVVSGLNEGDKVIVSGQVNLTDNKPIKVLNND
ncbi:MAG: efflux RND transporter periplasmic adaptor subunit [Candidatus Zixiibacteriota bacterium]